MWGRGLLTLLSGRVNVHSTLRSPRRIGQAQVPGPSKLHMCLPLIPPRGKVLFNDQILFVSRTSIHIASKNSPNLLCNLLG